MSLQLTYFEISFLSKDKSLDGKHEALHSNTCLHESFLDSDDVQGILKVSL